MPDNSKSKLMAAGAVVILAIAAVLIARQSNPIGAPPATQQAWYLDIDSGALFSDAYGRNTPFDAPGGGKAVRAHVYRNGDCDDVGPSDIAYLTRYTDAALAELAKPDAQRRFDIVDAGLLVAAHTPGQQPQWTPATSPQGAKLITAASGGECLP